MKEGCDCIVNQMSLKRGRPNPPQPSPAAADKVTCHNIMVVGVILTLMLGGMDSKQNQEELFEVSL